MPILCSSPVRAKAGSPCTGIGFASDRVGADFFVLFDVGRPSPSANRRAVVDWAFLQPVD